MKKEVVDSLELFDLNTEREIYFRKGTTDYNCLKEVVTNHCYRHKTFGMDVEEGEHWLDLGGNIGAFGVYCLLNGATAEGYEPFLENYEMIKLNCPELTYHQSAVSCSKEKKLPFFTGSKQTDRYRFTLLKNTKPSDNYFDNIFVGDIDASKYDGVKIDIEGSELEMFDKKILPLPNKMVMEYHLLKDRNMANFRRRMAWLRSKYHDVHYIKGLDRNFDNDTYPFTFDRFVLAKNLK